MTFHESELAEMRAGTALCMECAFRRQEAIFLGEVLDGQHQELMAQLKERLERERLGGSLHEPVSDDLSDQQIRAIIEKSTSRWISFDDQLEGFKDQPVTACYLGKLYHFWVFRSNWGRDSHTYPGQDSLSVSLEDVKAKIERRRVQGSQWFIDELPTLVVAGESRSLLITEINTDKPLSRFTKTRLSTRTVRQVGRHFAPHKPDSVIRMMCDQGLVSPARLPFRRFRSISGSRASPLQWKRIDSVASLDAVLDIANRVTKSVQRRDAP